MQKTTKEEVDKLEQKMVNISKFVNNLYENSKDKELLNISKLADNLLQEVHLLK